MSGEWSVVSDQEKTNSTVLLNESVEVTHHWTLTTTQMIDTHCHLTDPRLGSQLEDVLDRAAAAGVTRMITIGTSLADDEAAIALCRGRITYAALSAFILTMLTRSPWRSCPAYGISRPIRRW